MPEHIKWPSIQRLSSETCYLTEKIDGSNAVIYVPESPDEPVLAGSRNNWLTVEKDNFGFAAWVAERAAALRQLGPGYHYGEFYGHGIQRGYGMTTRRFASFEYWRKDLAIDGVDVVPVLYEGAPDGIWAADITPVAVWDYYVHELKTKGSVLVPGFMQPEGVVITFKNMNTAKFKRLCENDLIHKYQIPK